MAHSPEQVGRWLREMSDASNLLRERERFVALLERRRLALQTQPGLPGADPRARSGTDEDKPGQPR